MDAVAKNALASLSSLMVVHGSTANDLALTTAATAFSGVGGALRRAAGSADGSGAGFACCHQKNPAATSSALPATHTATGPRRPAFGCRPGRWPGARSATGPTSDTAPPNTLRTRAPNAPDTSPPPARNATTIRRAAAASCDASLTHTTPPGRIDGGLVPGRDLRPRPVAVTPPPDEPKSRAPFRPRVVRSGGRSSAGCLDSQLRPGAIPPAIPLYPPACDQQAHPVPASAISHRSSPRFRPVAKSDERSPAVSGLRPFTDSSPTAPPPTAAAPRIPRASSPAALPVHA